MQSVSHLDLSVIRLKHLTAVATPASSWLFEVRE